MKIRKFLRNYLLLRNFPFSIRREGTVCSAEIGGGSEWGQSRLSFNGWKKKIDKNFSVIRLMQHSS